MTAEGSGARKKKRRRKRMRSDNHLREEVGSSSEERDRLKEYEREADASLWDSPTSEDLSTPLQARSDNKAYIKRVSLVCLIKKKPHLDNFGLYKI